MVYQSQHLLSSQIFPAFLPFSGLVFTSIPIPFQSLSLSVNPSLPPSILTRCSLSPSSQCVHPLLSSLNTHQLITLPVHCGLKTGLTHTRSGLQKNMKAHTHTHTLPCTTLSLARVWKQATGVVMTGKQQEVHSHRRAKIATHTQLEKSIFTQTKQSSMTSTPIWSHETDKHKGKHHQITEIHLASVFTNSTWWRTETTHPPIHVEL